MYLQSMNSKLRYSDYEFEACPPKKKRWKEGVKRKGMEKGRKSVKGKCSLEYSMFFAEHSKQKKQRLRPMYIPIVRKKLGRVMELSNSCSQVSVSGVWVTWLCTKRPYILWSRLVIIGSQDSKLENCRKFAIEIALYAFLLKEQVES